MFKFILIFLSPLFLFGQQRELTLDFSAFFKKGTTHIDSVLFIKQKLIVENKKSLRLLFTENEIGQDSLFPLYIFAKRRVYAIGLSRDYLTYCLIAHKITFFYYKRKPYYVLSDCTSAKIMGPLTLLDVKKRK